jgi:hypothetical protein
VGLHGTGALGDMGCHLIEAPFSVLNLKYAKDVQCSVGSHYVDEFQRGYQELSAFKSRNNFSKKRKNKW